MQSLFGTLSLELVLPTLHETGYSNIILPCRHSISQIKYRYLILKNAFKKLISSNSVVNTETCLSTSKSIFICIVQSNK